MSDNSSYELTYFNGRGLAEVSRYLFAAAGVEYKDHRFPSDDDRKAWLALKPTTPLGKVPILTINGKTILAQSKAIERFLAKRFGFYGNTEIEAAQIDQFGEELRDNINSWFPVRTDPEKLKALYEGDMKTSFGKLNHLATSHGFFVGNKLSLTDIQFTYLLENIGAENAAKLLDGHDNLKKITEQVKNQAGIKAWIAKRPTTPF